MMITVETIALIFRLSLKPVYCAIIHLEEVLFFATVDIISNDDI